MIPYLLQINKILTSTLTPNSNPNTNPHLCPDSPCAKYSGKNKARLNRKIKSRSTGRLELGSGLGSELSVSVRVRDWISVRVRVC
jgi:hypothetical protein